MSSFALDASNPDRADPASEAKLVFVDDPYGNHNGGALAFGPDGFLYIATGDGGSGGDPHGNGQSLETLLGKILRIDIDNTDGDRAYAIPPDNPFATPGRSDARDLRLRDAESLADELRPRERRPLDR